MNALPRVLFSAAALTSSFRLLVLKQSGFPTFVFFFSLFLSGLYHCYLSKNNLPTLHVSLIGWLPTATALSASADHWSLVTVMSLPHSLWCPGCCPPRTVPDPNGISAHQLPWQLHPELVIGPVCLPALTRLLVAAITPAKRALWSLASYALYGCLGRQWGDTDSPSPPQSLWTVFLLSPLPPLFPFITHIYGWKWYVTPIPPTPHSQLLSDGWRDWGINLGFMGTPVPLSTAVWDLRLPLCLFPLDHVLSVFLCVHVKGFSRQTSHEQGKWCILRIASKWAVICLPSTGSS